MLVAVISDTHMPRGSRALPEACVEYLEGADLVLHAGDVVAESVLVDLEQIGAPVLAVHGNVDEEALVRRLPAERTVGRGRPHRHGPRRRPGTRAAGADAPPLP